LFNIRVDLEQSRRSIEIAKRIERELGATVWLHHDLEAQREVRTAPAWYEGRSGAEQRNVQTSYS
jgi:hypothetical protein